MHKAMKNAAEKLGKILTSFGIKKRCEKLKRVKIYC